MAHLSACLNSTRRDERHNMRTSIRSIGALAAAAVVIPAGVALALSDDVLVRGTAADEIVGAADADSGYLAWSQNSTADRNHYNAFFSLNGGPEEQVNEGGTIGWAGGIDG